MLAECARMQGRFAMVHHDMANGRVPLNRSSFLRAAPALGLDPVRITKEYALATKQVDADVMSGRQLHVSWTPTLFLCCPDHKVFMLGSVSQVAQFLR